VIGDGLVGQLVGGVLLQLASPPPGDVRVHHGAPHVIVQGGPVVDLAPGEVGLGQRGLDEILGIRLVTGQHVGGPEQRRLTIMDILPESGLIRLGTRPSVIAHDAHAT
jgi:hypothetical protein